MYPPDCMGSSMQAGEVLEPRTVLLEFPIHMERTAFRSAVTRSIQIATWTRQSWRTTRIARVPMASQRSEEHTSELQSRGHLVCRLLLEKKISFRRGGLGWTYVARRDLRALDVR